MTALATCQWFDGQAEEAARFYVSLLPGSRIDAVTPSPSTGRRVGRAMSAMMEMVKLDLPVLERAFAGAT